MIMKKLKHEHNFEKNYALSDEQLQEATTKFWDSVVDSMQKVIDDHGVQWAGRILRQDVETGSGRSGIGIENSFQAIATDFKGVEQKHLQKKQEAELKEKA